MKKLVFSTALVLSLGIAGCSGMTTKEETPKDEKPVAEMIEDDASKSETSAPDGKEVAKKDGKLTEAKFKQIKQGMTLEEVSSIVGSKGRVISERGTDGDSQHIAIYEFETDDVFAPSTMVFQGDKLSYKAQVGLEKSEIEITLEQLNKLEKGMSKERVFEILGGNGVLVAESEVLEIYSYNNPTSDADVTLKFIEGKFKSNGELKGSM